MFLLVYASSAVELFNEKALHDLLEVCHHNNAKLDITGLLLYHDGSFIQAIEGPEKAVQGLYQKIKRDPRHKDIFTLVEQPVSERNFPSWSMGFQSLTSLPVDRPGFSTFLTKSDTSLVEVFRNNPQRANLLLLTFRDNMI